jgi:hypothetical protein
MYVCGCVCAKAAVTAYLKTEFVLLFLVVVAVVVHYLGEQNRNTRVEGTNKDRRCKTTEDVLLTFIYSASVLLFARFLLLLLLLSSSD